MLALENVTRRFGQTLAVDDVSLTVADGEMVGIIGRSGAGKSTLLRMLNRLVAPSQGRIRFGGTDVTALRGAKRREWQRDCAMIFQQFNLVPRLDVLTNVLLGRLNHRSTAANLLGLYSDAERADAVRALDRLGIAATAMQAAGTLSGGQQQRVAIARALMQRPRMILADEPIASLDPLNAKIVMDALADINAREGLTVVTNLHTLDTARTYCERIIGMAGGRVVFDGTAAELTAEAARAIYGAQAEMSEAVTSTSLDTPAPPASAAPTNGAVNGRAVPVEPDAPAPHDAPYDPAPYQLADRTRQAETWQARTRQARTRQERQAETVGDL